MAYLAVNCDMSRLFDSVTLQAVSSSCVFSLELSWLASRRWITSKKSCCR